MMTETYNKLADMLVDRFEVDPTAIKPGVTFDQLEMDSLFLVELLLVIESELGVKIDEDSVSPQDTIERAAELLAEQLAEARP